MPELRTCPNCGAASPGDGEWCNQCYTRFTSTDEPAQAAVATEASLSSVDSTTDETVTSQTAPPPTEGQFWTCRVCETTNPLAVSDCRACGTSIFDSLTGDAPSGPSPNPPQIGVWPLIPGAGHVKADQELLGVTLGLLILLNLSFGLLFLTTVSVPVGILLLGGGAAIWLVSFHDAYRWAQGEPEQVLLRPRVVTIVAALAIMLIVVGFVVAGSRLGQT